jgi:hypothetical protein
MSTYNPIIECVELRRVRIGSPLRTPANGTALVLERAVGAPVVVRHGERVQEARLGNYRRMYVVDVATRGVSFTTAAPSKDHAFPFTVTVRFSCQVTNPVTIARNDVTDMTAALSPSLATIVREVAARFDVLHPTEAESAINARLNSAYPTIDVELSGFSVFVNVPDTAEIISKIREHRVEGMVREHHRDIAAGGREALILHGLTKGADPLEILDRHRQDAALEMDMKLEALRALTGDTAHAADKTDIHRQMLSEFFPGDDSAAKTRSSMRDRLNRRTNAALDGGRVVEGTAPADPPAAETSTSTTKDPAAPTSEVPAPPPSNGARSSRVRGSMGSRSSDEDQ